jgi:arsenate reductase
MELWTNSRCSKSRAAQQILDDRGITYTERRYLEDPPTREELKALLAKGITLEELTREPSVTLDDLAEDPSKLQRPIAVHQGRAIVARPPEKVLDLL